MAKIKPSKPSNLNDAHLLNLRLAPTHPFNHVSATVGRRKQGGEGVWARGKQSGATLGVFLAALLFAICFAAANCFV